MFGTSARTRAPSRRRLRKGCPKAAKGLLVHQDLELAGKVRTNGWRRIVTLILQGSENFFSGAATARPGELKSSVEGSVGWGWHGAFRPKHPQRELNVSARNWFQEGNKHEASSDPAFFLTPTRALSRQDA
jgi:hypothetical protein